MNRSLSRFFSVLTVGLCLSFSAMAAPTVEMKTNMGDIVIELDSAKAPKTVENFMRYVESGFYNNTIFHRVIDSFMIQGGGFDPKMGEKPTSQKINNEAKNGLKNKRGTIAMARTNDPHSATAQFFINLVDNNFLDFTGEQSSKAWGYAVFGKVTQGMEVVDKIAKVKTGNAAGHQNVPVETIIIESVKIIPEKK